jgi:hypothetical protein
MPSKTLYLIWEDSTFWRVRLTNVTRCSCTCATCHLRARTSIISERIGARSTASGMWRGESYDSRARGRFMRPVRQR